MSRNRAVLAITLAVLALALPTAAQLDADFTATPLSGTNPLTVDFSDLTTGGPPTVQVWYFGDGTTSTEANPTHTYTTPGTYTVSLTVVSGLLIDTETKTDLIEIAPAPLVPSFSATPTSGDNPLIVAFADTSTGAVVTEWAWDFGDGSFPFPSTSAEPAPSHTYTAPGTYTVSLTASVGGQDATVTKTDLITVDPAPLVPDFTATPTSGINPLTVSFTDLTTGTTPTAWLWDFGDGAGSSEQHPQHIFTGDFSYDVSLTVFVGQQSATIGKPDLIQPDPAPLVPTFDVDTLTGPPPLTVSFTGFTTGVEPTNWTWGFGDGTLGPHAPEAEHTYTVPGTYDVFFAAFFGQQQETAWAPDLITVLPLPSLDERFTLVPVDGWEYDEFGSAVAVSGHRALVGAPQAQGFGNSGAAYVFDLDTGAQLHELVPDDALPGIRFGASVALEGSLVLVGARGDDTLGNQAGAAYLFDAVSGAQLAKLHPTGLEASDAFGERVALDSDLALISAPGDDDEAPSAGAAYLFDVSVPTAPVQIAKLTAGDGEYGDRFGSSVALHGDRALVGEHDDDEQAIDAGAAYLFDISVPGQPVLVAKLTDPEGSLSDGLGTDVALTADFALAGAPSKPSVLWDAGAVLVFDSATGELLTELVAPDARIGQGFGLAVAASGSVAVVGAPASDPEDSGISLFDLPSGELRAQLATDGEDLFGRHVALDGDRAVIGTQPVAYDFTGSAVVYDVPLGAWSDLGQGLAGVDGEPRLTGLGPATSAGPLLLGLTGTAPEAVTFLVVGLSELGTPFLGGVLVPSPDVVISLATDAVGDLWIEDALPPGLPAGTAWTLQHWIVDAAGPSGFAASNGLRATTP